MYKKKNETELRVSAESTLMDLLLDKMGGMTKTSIKNLLSRRVVRVNGRVETRPDTMLQAGDTVVIVPEHGQRLLTHPKLRVVYEDDYLIVVEKQPGLLTVAAHPGSAETTAFSLLRDYVKKADKRNGIYVVHRLDRETSGLLVFAKTKELQEYMREYWRQLVTKRTYVAIVEGTMPKEEDTIRTWLSEDPKTTMVYSSPVDDGGKEAVTHYKCIKSNGDYSLLELNLETGRTNQIRVHMASVGHPVVSDRKYGSGKVPPIDRLGLHARILEFIHPATEQTVHFETPVPREFLRVFHG
ncbi:MAG: RluA family pseudouridine synthase [Paludibacteraceae bacterium]|nr:RluA family pseudouridine synthase [Paludibacteraceae bacterium]